MVGPLSDGVKYDAQKLWRFSVGLFMLCHSRCSNFKSWKWEAPQWNCKAKSWRKGSFQTLKKDMSLWRNIWLIWHMHIHSVLVFLMMTPSIHHPNCFPPIFLKHVTFIFPKTSKELTGTRQDCKRLEQLHRSLSILAGCLSKFWSALILVVQP